MKQSEALDMITKIQLAHQAMESACKRIDELKEENKNLKEALAKQEQGEPVGFYDARGNDICIEIPIGESADWWQPVYTTPQQRTWVGLTEQEQGAIMESLNAYGTNLYHFANAIEAKLKEKNT